MIFAGWLVGTLVSALEGAVVGGGLAAIGGALTSIGIPQDSVIAYESAIKAGRFLVIVRGTDEEIGRAKSILTELGATGLDVTEHHAVDIAS